LFEENKVFDLKEAVEAAASTNPGEDLFFRGVVANRLGQDELSIDHLSRFLQEAAGSPDKYLLAANEVLADDYRKLGNYARTAEVYRQILNRYRIQLGPTKQTKYEAMASLWESIKDVRPQRVIIGTGSTIKTSRNDADLVELPISVNGASLKVVLDTGANLSLVSETNAKKLGLDDYESQVYLGTSTGKLQPGRIGVAKEVRVGKALLVNVLFVILADEALRLPGAGQLDGVLGIPLIRQLGSFTLSKSGQMTIPAIATSNESTTAKFAFLGMSPVVKGEYGGKSWILTIDTGANSTELYPSFFESFRADIIGRYKRHPTYRGGLGNTVRVDIYRGENMTFRFGDKAISLPEAGIYPTVVSDMSGQVDGNLGQSFMRTFSQFSMDFRSMTLTLQS